MAIRLSPGVYVTEIDLTTSLEQVGTGGIENAVADADFTAELTVSRTAIANAKTTADLVAVANPA